VNVGSSHDPSDHRSPPIVLVGHCYGGAVITNAATGDLDVRALVYIEGFAPDQGETIVELATARPGSAIAGDPATVFRRRGRAGDGSQRGFQAGLLLAAGIVVVAVVLSAAVSRGSLPAARRGPAAAIVTPDQA
jgi:pimeloyl-ACP methyl ester carboxylesterase